MSHPPGLWDAVLRRLEAHVPTCSQPIRSLDWVRDLTVAQDEDALVLLCQSSFQRDRVRKHFLSAIECSLEQELGRPLRVQLEVDELDRRSESRPRAVPAQGPAASPARPAPAGPVAGGAVALPLPAPRQREFCFEDFVVGPCNELAQAAAVAVAQGRQPRANPLYLVAPTGNGKTHLARAILREVSRPSRRRPPDGSHRIYRSCDDFTHDFTQALRKNRIEGFKRYYRSANLLVLEDVQLLRRKTATQLELFQTVVHLLEKGGRVVLTGDRMPHEIDDLDGRLRSQMSAGLVAEIGQPEPELRRQILRAKAAAAGVHLPEDCREILVEGARGNVRDLEGVLIQLVESSLLLKRPIDAELTRSALRKVLPGSTAARRLEVDEVVRTVATFSGSTPELIRSRSRRRAVVQLRQLAMYLCRRYTDASLGEIGAALGRKHPAVKNAVEAIERTILRSVPIRLQVEALVERLEELRQSRA